MEWLVMVKSIDSKPTLRIGAYRHAMGDGFAEFPLRLEYDRRTGQHYWATARGGELHWWLMVKCTDYHFSA